ncbi:hypothetical protein NEOLEDRAFT_1167151 [Neolentinus lepideus HHB14362 ss-1]|uniref:Uncharacterized protein n=1 Tax=Neolentinus lepideus HHB14362 ss-1 TaxID=1314782 RepID=A0A165V481_9AGAM|nr:hypothetical protein NEOLEDRAFT_1167151 [Neolentinus lepideus HHB14362 ss-1]
MCAPRLWTDTSTFSCASIARYLRRRTKPGVLIMLKGGLDGGCLRVMSRRGAVWPEGWKVEWGLVARFVDLTREDMVGLLSKAGSSLDVKVLLDTLQQTLDFEACMSRKLVVPSHLKHARPAPLSLSKVTKSRPSLDISSVSEDEDNESPVVTESGGVCKIVKTLFDLGDILKKCLRVYVEEVLLAGLKRPTHQPRKSMEARSDRRELKNASRLEPGSIGVLLQELKATGEPEFATRTRTAWGAVSQVSRQSPYITELVGGIERVVDTARPMIEQKKYWRNFLDKASSLILTRFTNALVKSRPLKDIGAEQLLIDLQAVKASLLKFSSDSSSSYTRSVTKSTTRLEALLKVIVTPVDPPDGFILNYILLIGDDSFSNFQKNGLFDSFVTTTSTNPDLESTSFLSSLDMDPPTASQTPSLMSPSSSNINLRNLLAEKSDGLVSPPLTNPSPSIDASQLKAEVTPQKRDVFMDVKRLVSFASGLRRDTAPGS